jgi:cell division initiation protein
MSPVEIQTQVFRKTLRGFDPEEVKLFLTNVADSYQSLVLENTKLTQEVTHLSAALDEFRKRETLLKEALYSAQKTADEVRSQADREARNIVHEAELKGEAALRDAQARAHRIERQILDLKTEREGLLRSVRDILRRITVMVDAIEGQKDGENVQSFGQDQA